MKQGMQKDYLESTVLEYEQAILGKTPGKENELQALLASAGNLYHQWRSVTWPFEENKSSEDTNEQSPKVAPLTETEIEEEVPTVDLSTVCLDCAAISTVTDQLFSAPTIQNKQINWVDEWTEETYKDLGVEETGLTSQKESEHILFESIEPLTETTESDILSDMQESNFLKWLKSKNDDTSNFHELRTEEEKVEEKASEHKKKKKHSKEKLSKKKKKKELKKILKKSLEIEDEIVSETLANVMVQQGHIQKAKRMYEKLSLIFPEKSAYFAQRIENLEEE